MARATRSPALSASPARSGAASTVADRASALVDRAGLWMLRLAWFLAPLGIGIGLTDRLDRFEGAGATVAELSLWAAWFAGLLACLVPTTISLTVVRVLAPATIVLLVLAASVGGGDGWSNARLIALGYGVALTLVAFLPVTGDRMINGSAYGSERRMALRPPAFSLLGPVQLAWALVVAGLLTGPVLLAGGRWVIGTVACVIGVGACWLGGRVLHQLARRWIVFVPAGFVIHDHVLLVESILLRRPIVAALGPATLPVPESAVDLSGGAFGLALEVATKEPVSFGRRASRQVLNTDAERIVFTPSLPGAVLREARIRAIRIGAVDDINAGDHAEGQPVHAEGQPAHDSPDHEIREQDQGPPPGPEATGGPEGRQPA